MAKKRKRRGVPAAYLPRGIVLQQAIAKIRDGWTESERLNRMGYTQDRYGAAMSVETKLVRWRDVDLEGAA